MLRVGLTGELGSGKSTVAHMLAKRGAIVLPSDEMARAMMQPGQAVFDAIVKSFGPSVLTPEGTIDRGLLARLAFDVAQPRIEELNAIVHPAVLAEQARQIARIAQKTPNAIVVIESALIFSARDGSMPWRERFDAIVLVQAPEAVKVQRFISRVAQGRAMGEDDRAALEADARSRLSHQAITAEQAAGCIVLENRGDLKELDAGADRVWAELQSLAVKL